VFACANTLEMPDLLGESVWMDEGSNLTAPTILLSVTAGAKVELSPLLAVFLALLAHHFLCRSVPPE
jgi:hypothetical protein